MEEIQGTTNDAREATTGGHQERHAQHTTEGTTTNGVIDMDKILLESAINGELGVCLLAFVVGSQLRFS